MALRSGPTRPYLPAKLHTTPHSATVHPVPSTERSQTSQRHHRTSQHVGPTNSQHCKLGHMPGLQLTWLQNHPCPRGFCSPAHTAEGCRYPEAVSSPSCVPPPPSLLSQTLTHPGANAPSRQTLPQRSQDCTHPLICNSPSPWSGALPSTFPVCSPFHLIATPPSICNPPHPVCNSPSVCNAPRICSSPVHLQFSSACNPSIQYL